MDEKEPTIKDLQEAIADGRVSSFAEGTVVFDGGSEKLVVSDDIGIEGCFGLTACDEGGFTGLVVPLSEWDGIKAKVDEAIKNMKSKLM